MLSLSEPIKCNILLIGKTGTGKSSFANYLFNTKRFTTGSGAPVTGWEDNFQYHNFNISNISVNVYDSVGLEPNNFDRWMKELDAFLKERQVNKYGNVKSANDIMHTVFYVINGASARIEEGEIQILEKLRSKYNLSTSVIITNCDIAKEQMLTTIESKVKKYELNSFRVCSVSKKTRGGDKVEPFGKEPAIRQILSSSYEKVGKELTLSILNEAISVMNNARQQAKLKIDASDLSVFNLEALESINLDDILPDFSSIYDIVPPEYESYQNFLGHFDVDYQGRDIMNETIDNLYNILSGMGVESIKLGQKAKKVEYALENGGFFDKVGAVFQTLELVLTIKSSIKKAIDEMFDLVINQLRKQLLKVENTV